MTFRRIFLSSTAIAIFVLFCLSTPVGAQSDGFGKDALQQLEAGAKKTELQKADPRSTVAGVIKTTLSVIGILFIILIIQGGYWRMTAQGQEEKIEKSNKTIMGAVIGIIIVTLSYVITDFVARRVYNAAQTTPVYEIQNPEIPQQQWGVPVINIQ